MDLTDYILQLEQRLTEAERKLATMIRHGPVTEVDTKKQMVRIQLNPEGQGQDKEDPFLTAWVPYAQQAGAYKFHNPPSKGQNMTVISPGGDPGQAIALPFTWSNAFKSPGDSEDEHKITFGDSLVSIKKDTLDVKNGAGFMRVQGKHAHLGVGKTRIWMDEKGVYSTVEIVVKKDED